MVTRLDNSTGLGLNFLQRTTLYKNSYLPNQAMFGGNSYDNVPVGWQIAENAFNPLQNVLYMWAADKWGNGGSGSSSSSSKPTVEYREISDINKDIATELAKLPEGFNTEDKYSKDTDTILAATNEGKDYTAQEGTVNELKSKIKAITEFSSVESAKSFVKTYEALPNDDNQKTTDKEKYEQAKLYIELSEQLKQAEETLKEKETAKNNKKTEITEVKKQLKTLLAERADAQSALDAETFDEGDGKKLGRMGDNKYDKLFKSDGTLEAGSSSKRAIKTAIHRFAEATTDEEKEKIAKQVANLVKDYGYQELDKPQQKSVDIIKDKYPELF